jgi:hypothetical protein
MVRSMSSSEIKVLVFLGLVFFIYLVVGIRSLGKCALLFLVACLTGCLAQLPLGPELNHYTPNITLYVSFVSIAVIITWGIGLASAYLANVWMAKLFRIPESVGLYCLCAVVILIMIEAAGSNIILMKLHNYSQYVSLMPALNSMHAPKWMYAYYSSVGVLFYFIAKALRF